MRVYYQVLKATTAQIKAASRSLALHLLPDATRGGEAEEVMSSGNGSGAACSSSMVAKLYTLLCALSPHSFLVIGEEDPEGLHYGCMEQ